MGETQPTRAVVKYRAGDRRPDDTPAVPPMVERCFKERGWVEWDELNDDARSWTVHWKSGRFKTNEYAHAKPDVTHQRINHYPKTSPICVKDQIVRLMRRLRSTYGAAFDFLPQSYLLPNEYLKLVKAHTEQTKKSRWICKPADSSRGRGIFIIEHLDELEYDCNYIAQRYVDRPLLLGGYKFDLRLYVAVTSMHPLKIFLHDEGLCRFGTQKYNEHDYTNVFSHLTNASINKFSPSYDNDKDTIGPGCKWSIAKLKEHLRSNAGAFGGLDVDKVWERIKGIIVLTLLAIPSTVPRVADELCFELFGFDVLIDASGKPWLLEVNTSPAMGSDCELDERVKLPMLHDLLDLVDIKPWRGDGSKDECLGTPSKRTSTAARNEVSVPSGCGSRPRAATAAGRLRREEGISGSGGEGSHTERSTSSASETDASLGAARGRVATSDAGSRPQPRGSAGPGSDPAVTSSLATRATSASRPVSGLSAAAQLARCRTPLSSAGGARRALSTLNRQVAEIQSKPREQGGMRMIFPWGPEVDELACRIGGAGDGKEPVDVFRECVNKVRTHYGVGGNRAASAAAARQKTEKRAMLMHYYKNGDGVASRS